MIQFKESGTLDEEALRDILESSELIKDTVPFIVGLMDKVNQSALSWNIEDLITAATYEGKALNVRYERRHVRTSLSMAASVTRMLSCLQL